VDGGWTQSDQNGGTVWRAYECTENDRVQALVYTQHNLMLSFIDYVLWQTDLNAVCTEADHHTTIVCTVTDWHTTIQCICGSDTSHTHHHHHHHTVCTGGRSTQNIISKVADWHSSVLWQTYAPPHKETLIPLYSYTHNLAPVRWCFILLQEHGRLLFLLLRIKFSSISKMAGGCHSYHLI